MDIVCFCHLRWDFVYQRPQHLLSRFAKRCRVFVVEEPVFTDQPSYLNVSNRDEHLFIITPHLSNRAPGIDHLQAQRELLSPYFRNLGLKEFILWYYTPMAMPLSTALPSPALVVYDCMDELSAFKFAPHDIKEREAKLLEVADLVFTGGYSIYEAKKHLHKNIHAFPSSIDKEHFAKARNIQVLPKEYDNIPKPRMGFYGVLDERFDIDLLRDMAAMRPDCHFIMIGPVVKIEPEILPRAENIHYLGSKSYQELPYHLAAWDLALIPFAINESTQFISPTKTPEYLAGGRPVISTPIRDVVTPYGDENLVYIGNTGAEFVKGIEWGLAIRDDPGWLRKVDEFLADISWNITWEKMIALIKETKEQKPDNLKKRSNEHV
ncbi:glycosyltransferase family protein [Flavitalea sp.]|nr:glycosyltransferase [Flavitalea sp.]